MKISEINLKEEGAKYYCKEVLENFIVRYGDLVGENSGVDITCIFTIGRIMDIEFERVETVKNPYERVKKDKLYYFTTAYREVKCASETDHELDNKMIKSENYFNNKNYAEYINFKENLLRKLDRFAWEHNKEVIDWDNTEKRKYKIIYNYKYKILEIECEIRRREMGIYFDSAETARAAMEAFEADLMKLYTWEFDF